MNTFSNNDGGLSLIFIYFLKFVVPAVVVITFINATFVGWDVVPYFWGENWVDSIIQVFK